MWDLGSKLDTHVASSGRCDAAGAPLPGLTGEVLRPLVLGNGDRHVGVELNRYLSKGYAVLSGRQFYSMAPGASKVGNKGLLVTPLVDNQSGQAMWAAPQVPPAQTSPSTYQEHFSNTASIVVTCLLH